MVSILPFRRLVDNGQCDVTNARSMQCRTDLRPLGLACNWIRRAPPARALDLFRPGSPVKLSSGAVELGGALGRRSRSSARLIHLASLHNLPDSLLILASRCGLLTLPIRARTTHWTHSASPHLLLDFGEKLS